MIDTEEKLSALLPALRAAPWIALDTEADSLHAYPEKLCLLQISGEGIEALVDPLASVSLVPLLKIFGDHELIMHGSDYDLRLFRKTFDFKPKAIFDTMLAARLLGLREFGLGNLVQSRPGLRKAAAPLLTYLSAPAEKAKKTRRERAAAREEGRAEGRAEGQAQGESVGIRRVAAGMLRQGLAVDVVAEAANGRSRQAATQDEKQPGR